LLHLEWESSVTSTIYDSVATSKVFKASFDHFQGRLSPNSCANIPHLTTLWCSISQTVRTKKVVEHGSFLLRAVMSWSRSSLHSPAVHYTLGWLSATSIWIDSHPIAWCFLFLLLHISCTSLQWVSLVIFSVAIIAESGELTVVCVATVSHWVGHCLKQLLFGSIRLQSHLVEVYLEPWLDVVEWWGRWLWKEGGSPEEDIVSYKSKWNEWQLTCTFISSWI